MKNFFISLELLLLITFLSMNTCTAGDDLGCDPYISIVPGECATYPPEMNDPDQLKFASGPNEIAPNTSAIFTITGGLPPYTWSVSGNGFSMAQPGTQQKTNTLIAGSTICGTATITVEDACNQVIEIDVRSPTGKWVEIQSQCMIKGPPNQPNYGIYEVRIDGKYKQLQSYKTIVNTSGKWCGNCMQPPACSESSNECVYYTGTYSSQGKWARVCGNDLVFYYCDPSTICDPDDGSLFFYWSIIKLDNRILKLYEWKCP